MRIYLLFFILYFSCIYSVTAQFVTNDGKKLTVEICLEKSKERENQSDYRGASDFMNKAALIHWDKKELRPAITYFQKSLFFNQKVDNQSGMYGIYSNLATIYADLEQFDSALIFFQKTLEGRKQLGVREAIISAQINTSVVLNNLKRHDEAAQHLLDGLDLAKESLDLEQMRSLYGMLAETYDKAGNNEKTKYYFDLYRNFHEMSQQRKIAIVSAEADKARLQAALAKTQKQRAELEIALKNTKLKEQEKHIESKNETLNKLESNFTKQELAYKVLQQETDLKDAKNAQEQAENEKKIARQRLYIGMFAGILLFALIGIIFIFRSKQQKKKANLKLQEKNNEISFQQAQIMKQNHELETALDDIENKNEQITSSITYAKRIQEAMLPNISNIQKVLPESFIFFRPRDIVSGDFYFFHHFEKEQKTILAAVDCTGHGVPGAFMSMIGNEILSRIVAENHIKSPAKILNQLNQGIKTALHKDETHIHDGMDLAIVCIDKKNKTLTFAGAKNPIFYIQNNQLEVIKGDKMPIGGSEREHKNNFTEHIIDISVPTTFYIFSDGFQDQFGGEKGRKFMVKNFRNLLFDIHTKNTAEQKQILYQTLKNWMGNKHKSIDDVLVIGGKV
ncbi:Stage II sporulation protein E (SpoIIE) [Bernardetia litoralis DSM 6794]|uniref:Stage II sporulation protein E (SpoIIE) n=1 Tax=Bernardetia litoralis (strain ATCC 23117 / DSM 6794 / NBRC 15988 / NCIMB 1366 / Fx l1 / Sio-4) TaxID=880071 RepID=I4APT2_BERLS|nr:SpoIIE family protein phosphatase [Bernardetia litoralis]AFM05967.1 Stage II sporulation protein E (SpoIIE) [Bernardetia litoralis DSM 6794]